MTSTQARFQFAMNLSEAHIDRSQRPRWWELRAATSLARLRHSQGRAGDAAALLGPVYAAFTEGLDGAALKQARAIVA